MAVETLIAIDTVGGIAIPYSQLVAAGFFEAESFVEPMIN